MVSHSARHFLTLSHRIKGYTNKDTAWVYRQSVILQPAGLCQTKKSPSPCPSQHSAASGGGPRQESGSALSQRGQLQIPGHSSPHSVHFSSNLCKGGCNFWGMIASQKIPRDILHLVICLHFVQNYKDLCVTNSYITFWKGKKGMVMPICDVLL